MPMRSIFAIVLGLVVLPVRATAACPTNIAFRGDPTDPHAISSSAPIWSDRVQCGQFSLNLVAGTIQLIGGGGGGEYSCSSGLHASDDYQLEGPASADPIPFQVRVHLTGDLTAGLQSYPIIGITCNWSRIWFTLSSGAASTVFSDETSYPPCVGKTISGDLALPLAKLPGEPFTVRYEPMSGTGGGVATINGVVSFTELPAGYSIVSCQGYGSQPVPALPTSWGRLKKAYR